MRIKKACVVIPMYTLQLSLFESISLQQAFAILAQHDIFFVIPEHLQDNFETFEYVADGRASSVTFDSAFFENIDGYNRLLKYPGFYRAFAGYEFMLIHQLDAFVFRDELLAWCQKGYDHVGAPLFQGHEKATASGELVGQGNGGFCLKNIKACYEVVSKFKKLRFTRLFETKAPNFFIAVLRYVKHQMLYIYSRYPLQPIINEDLFWAEVVPENFPGFKVPSPQEAMKFSFEINPEILLAINNDQLPFGCHAWWKYNLPFWREYINNFGYNISL